MIASKIHNFRKFYRKILIFLLNLIVEYEVKLREAIFKLGFLLSKKNLQVRFLRCYIVIGYTYTYSTNIYNVYHRRPSNFL